jgi:hypothetical protein
MPTLRRWTIAAGALLALAGGAAAQEQRYCSILPPFHSRLTAAGSESPMRLERQTFVLFVYRNAVVVHSAAEFVNGSADTLDQEFALPSTGHDENGAAPGGRLSTGLYDVQMKVQGERVAPGLEHDGDGDWYTIRTAVAPGDRRTVEALFWAETSLAEIDSLPGLDTAAIAPGRRGFLIDLAHAGAWNGAIEDIDITMVLRSRLSLKRDAFALVPDSYDTEDSTVTWSFLGLDPAAGDNVEVSYAPAGPWGLQPDTMARLSSYIVTKAYDEILHLVRESEEE